MTLQQLRYLIAIANHGSISAAAHTLYVSQSSLSVAVRDIERETGVTIFERSNRGITLTSDGIELLGYARQVVEQADLMEQRYSGRGGEAAQKLSITSQHYAFVVEAFLELSVLYSQSIFPSVSSTMMPSTQRVCRFSFRKSSLSCPPFSVSMLIFVLICLALSIARRRLLDSEDSL